jgi:hypothetical protein
MVFDCGLPISREFPTIEEARQHWADLYTDLATDIEIGARKEPDGSEAFDYKAEMDHQREFERECHATEVDDANELYTMEPEARHAFDGNQYSGLLSPHKS